MHLLWLVGQFALVMAGGAIILAAVVVIWYGVSLTVLTAVSHLFPMRGRKARSRRD
jgi:hypothetical protein